MPSVGAEGGPEWDEVQSAANKMLCGRGQVIPPGQTKSQAGRFSPACSTRQHQSKQHMKTSATIKLPAGVAPRLAIIFLSFCSLLAACGVARAQGWNWNPVGGLDTFISMNPADATLPPGAPGSGWARLPAAGQPIPPNTVFWLSFNNTPNADLTKFFRVQIRDRNGNNFAGVDKHQPGAGKPSGNGYSAAGVGSPGTYRGGGNLGPPAQRHDDWTFSPQPAWETLEYKTGNAPVVIDVKAQSACAAWYVDAWARITNLTFGAAGAMKTNQQVRCVMVFPRNIAIGPIGTNTPSMQANAYFSPPASTGNWTVRTLYSDPDGNARPLGGVCFVTDGDGLSVTQACNLGFALQGGRADLQYTMYAYDAASDDFQHFNIDLRPILTLSPTNGSVSLGFDSVQGANYTIQKTTNLVQWQPIVTLPGTGQPINNDQPMSDPLGLFRVRCDLAHYSFSNTPPTFISVTPSVLGDSLSLTFSEPVDELTATNLLNYYLADTSFNRVYPSQAIQYAPQSVELLIDPPLVSGADYYFGVHGIKDLAGELITPVTLPFTNKPPSPDVVPPGVVKVVPSQAGDSIHVTFDEPVDPSTASDPSNYYLVDPNFMAPNVTNAMLLGPRDVSLILDAPLSTTNLYALDIYRVNDLAGNQMLFGIEWNFEWPWTTHDSCMDMRHEIDDAADASRAADAKLASAMGTSSQRAAANDAASAAWNLRDLCSQFLAGWPTDDYATAVRAIKAEANDSLTAAQNAQ
jgi:hypothetical protein